MGKLHVKGWGYLNGKVACQGLRVSQKHTAKVTPESAIKLTPESAIVHYFHHTLNALIAV